MVILKTDRTYYSPEKAGEQTLTVQELIDKLQSFNPTEKVVFGGLTFGQIKQIHQEAGQ